MSMYWPGNLTEQGGSGPSAVTVNVPSEQALLSDLRDRMEQGRGFSIATLNLDHIVKLTRQDDFARAYAEHTHVTADGNPIVWLSRLAGDRIALLPGSDLIDPVAKLAAELGVSVALFGSTTEALDAAAQGLQKNHPGLIVATTLAPPMGFDPTGEEADTFIEALNASGAGLCFLALGAPKQEIFAAHAQARLPHMGFMSIGAGLDFIAGRQRRAPKIVRRFAAEWLWRLSLDPGRLFKRYAACIAVLPGLCVTALQVRLGRGRQR